MIDEIKHARTAKSGAKSEKKELFLLLDPPARQLWNSSSSWSFKNRVFFFFFFFALRVAGIQLIFFFWLSRTRCAHEAETGIPCGRVLRVRVATVALVTDNLTSRQSVLNQGPCCMGPEIGRICSLYHMYSIRISETMASTVDTRNTVQLGVRYAFMSDVT